MMQKIIKNWIVTMSALVLLLAAAVLMFLDGFDVGGLHIFDRQVIRLLVALYLVVYAAVVLIPLTRRYHGILRGSMIVEMLVLLLLATAQVCIIWIRIPVISSMEVCSVLGIAVWLRATVEIVHAYLSPLNWEEGKRVPLWRLLLYILLSAAGVWQMIDPSISDRSFIFVIAVATGALAALFAYLTIANYRAGAEERLLRKIMKEQEAALAKEAALEQEPVLEEEPQLLDELQLVEEPQPVDELMLVEELQSVEETEAQNEAESVLPEENAED